MSLLMYAFILTCSVGKFQKVFNFKNEFTSTSTGQLDLTEDGKDMNISQLGFNIGIAL